MVKVGEGSPDGLEMAARKLAEGEIVALPTDTVYGLACAAFRQEAVRRIYEIKERAEEKPLVLFLSDTEEAPQYAEVSEAAMNLMRRLWPGPVTLVCRAAKSAPPWVALRETVALRIPNHPVPLSLVRRLQAPLATTSANLSGQSPATTAAEVSAALSDRISLVIDGGPAPLGQPSTVVDASGPRPRILREGAGAEETRKAIAELWSESERQDGD